MPDDSRVSDRVLTSHALAEPSSGVC